MEVILGQPFLHQSLAHLDYGRQEITLVKRYPASTPIIKLRYT